MKGSTTANVCEGRLSELERQLAEASIDITSLKRCLSIQSQDMEIMESFISSWHGVGEVFKKFRAEKEKQANQMTNPTPPSTPQASETRHSRVKIKKEPALGCKITDFDFETALPVGDLETVVKSCGTSTGQSREMDNDVMEIIETSPSVFTSDGKMIFLENYDADEFKDSKDLIDQWKQDVYVKDEKMEDDEFKGSNKVDKKEESIDIEYLYGSDENDSFDFAKVEDEDDQVIIFRVVSNSGIHSVLNDEPVASSSRQKVSKMRTRRRQISSKLKAPKLEEDLDIMKYTCGMPPISDTRERRNKCPYCENRYLSKQGLGSHLKGVHKVFSRNLNRNNSVDGQGQPAILKEYSCTICPEKFNGSQALRYHREIEHGPNKKRKRNRKKGKTMSEEKLSIAMPKLRKKTVPDCTILQIKEEDVDEEDSTNLIEIPKKTIGKWPCNFCSKMFVYTTGAARHMENCKRKQALKFSGDLPNVVCRIPQKFLNRK